MKPILRKKPAPPSAYKDAGIDIDAQERGLAKVKKLVHIDRCASIYADKPITQQPGIPRDFFVWQQPTGSVADLNTAFGNVIASGGGDTPEDWLIALHRIAKENAVHFRPNSSKIVVVIGDASSHDDQHPADL